MNIQNRIEIQIYAIKEFAKLWKEEPNLDKKSDIYSVFCKYVYAIAEANSYIEGCDVNKELIEAINKETNQNDVISDFLSNSVDLIMVSDGYKSRESKK